MGTEVATELSSVAGVSSGLYVVDVITVSDTVASVALAVLLFSAFDCSVSSDELTISELVSDKTSGLSAFLLHEHNKRDVASNKVIIRFFILHLINY